MKVALATCLRPPQEDFDAPPLLAALAARGHRADVRAWDDPGVDWRAYDAVLLRSTWDYFHRLEAFLGWAQGVASVSRLWNPLAVVKWNTHKFYLRALAARGVPIVPTEFVPAGRSVDLAAILAAHAWDAAVIKPAVSADSFATLRTERQSPNDGQTHLEAHLPARDMLVQRYLPTVDEPGERCLVFIDGVYSHAVRKHSLFRGGRHAGPEGVPVLADADEIATAQRALESMGLGVPLYARVDLLRDESGTPRLMELELVEPSLFLTVRDDAAGALVEALERRVAGARIVGT